MISDERLSVLNEDAPDPKGKFVLYWMQASQRTRWNHALEHAIDLANAAGQPVVVGFGLMDDYPEANARHYQFMLEGLRDVKSSLAERDIRMVIRHGLPAEVAVELGKQASTIVCDVGYTRHQKAWRDHVADHAGRRVIAVESDVIVPVATASVKQEFGARTIRPRLHRHWPAFFTPVHARTPKHSSLHLRFDRELDVSDPARALEKLKVDRSVAPSPYFTGGEQAARKRLKAFLSERLDGYADGRNEPALGQTSTLSPYLHFGQISPLELVLAVREAKEIPAADCDSFVEELGVRRELAVNFVHYCPHYDRYEGLPAWAKTTLSEHRNDPRKYIYTRQQLEAADTYDPYWNAAQREMNKTGFMHNYMRMYWGKKVLEWSRSPQEGYENLMYLNNRLFLCGRDPNGYANVGWIFGLHDRPWGPERPIFGKVRYMNAAGLERKFDMRAYIEKVDRL